MKIASTTLKNASLCTHCGYCLPVCPTYQIENNELHAPRGRVSIVLALAADEITLSEASEALSHCLLCQACHTACPAGVRPAKLALKIRMLQPLHVAVTSRLLHTITNSHLLTHWFKTALSFYQSSGLQAQVRRQGWLKKLFPLESLIPSYRPFYTIPHFPDPTKTSDSKKNLKISLLGGCMARLFYPGCTPSAAQLIASMDIEVVIPQGFGCCGAPFRESGNRKKMVRQAKRTLNAFVAEGDLDAVICDSSICAVTLKTYARFLKHDPDYAEVADTFASKVFTFSDFIKKHENLLPTTTFNPKMGTITYQDHCQTAHGLGTITAPRDLLAKLPVVFRKLPSDGCCGAGGAYMLDHPQRSLAILNKKLADIHTTGADTVVGENPGCLLNIESGLNRINSQVQVRHLAEVLWKAYQPKQ